MVENRPGHEDTQQHGEDRREPPAADGAGAVRPGQGADAHPENAADVNVDAAIDSPPPLAAEPDPEEVRDTSAAELTEVSETSEADAPPRRAETEDAPPPEPEIATADSGTRFGSDSRDADEPAPRPSVAEPRRPGIAATMLPPVLAVAIAAAAVIGAGKAGLLPDYFTTGVSAPQGDAAAFDALKARVAELEARPAAGAAPVADATTIDALAARLASLEARPAPTGAESAATPSVAADPALAGKVEALEKTVASLRDDLADLRSRSEQLATAVKDARATSATDTPASDRPAADSAAALAAINARLADLEQAAKPATDAAPPAPPPAAADAPLRRLVTATMLDLTVRQGAPYAPILKAAQPLATEPAALQPLEPFAATGVPSAAALGRELVALLPKLLPGSDPANTTNFIDRFQANAERLIRIQRSDATPGVDRTAIVGRLTAAAQRGDLAEARRELKALAPADRAPVQSWIDRSEARDQALAASQSFATAALAALPKPSP
ncbi:COG4223 family protein [Rhodopseudomonas sp. NSM]|uniref:COG4223 family protein n=1 Tax=Rhodopseudomonas sp. NSM TaxID=3457630 RepID=UPI004037279F